MANEKRLIDANALLAGICKDCGNGCDLENDYCLLATEIMKAPTVDAVEVVHGRWEDMWKGKYANPRFRCSVCKTKALHINVLNGLGNWIDEQELSNYCPNCGAKMDGDGNEDVNL